MAAGLGPLSGGWRLLGRESVKILGIRFWHCSPGLCLERERASWLEQLSLEVRDGSVTIHMPPGLTGRYQA